MKDAWKDGIILAVLLISFIVGVFGILGLRRNATPAPALDVTMDDVTYTDKDKITISGKTDKNAKVRADGQEVEVKDDGSFTYEKGLSAGENKINLEASNAGKETTVVSKTVVRQEGDPSVKSAQDGEEQNELGQAGQPTELNNSGPVDSVFGALGIVSLLFVLNYYRRSLQVKA